MVRVLLRRQQLELELDRQVAAAAVFAIFFVGSLGCCSALAMSLEGSSHVAATAVSA